MFSFDSEDDSKGVVQIIDFFDGHNHTTFEGIACQERAIYFLYSMKDRSEKFFATNLEYDLINIFGDFYTKLLTLYYTPSGLIRAEFGKIKFYDTLRNWEMSVAQAGEYLGLPKLESDFSSVEYCRRDAEITWLLAHTMLERYEKIGLKLKATISSTAFNFWRENFCTASIYIKPEIRRYLSESMYGGRCEIFRYGEVDQTVFDYDINSSYAFAMKESNFPDLSQHLIKTSLPKKLDSLAGVARVEVFHPKGYFGFLPYRYRGKLFFPTGTFTGTWTLNELAFAVKYGVKIKKVSYVALFPIIQNPFTDFVDYIYKKRMGCQDKFMSYLYKKILNCVYGKFAERGILEVWRKGKYSLRESTPFWSNVIFSSTINSNARINLLQFMLISKKYLCYCDTDGFVLTKDIWRTSQELGELKMQGQYDRAVFILPKFYSLGDSYKSKGIPKNKSKEFMRKGRITYYQPVSFKEAQRRALKPNVWVKREKRLITNYDKRIVLKDYNTKPKELRHG